MGKYINNTSRLCVAPMPEADVFAKEHFAEGFPCAIWGIWPDRIPHPRGGGESIGGDEGWQRLSVRLAREGARPTNGTTARKTVSTASDGLTP